MLTMDVDGSCYTFSSLGNAPSGCCYRCPATKTTLDPQSDEAPSFQSTTENMPALPVRETRSPYHPASWVPHFRALTAKTRFISLSGELLTAVVSNTLTYPSQLDAPVEWSDGTTTNTSSSRIATPGLVQLSEAINATIAELSGAVAPKLGCRAPTDATWANFFRSTKCTSADDVLTLLAASVRVARSLSPNDVLVLRQWADMDPRMEFRVFVRDDTIVGVCQRAEICVEYQEAEMDALVDLLMGRHRELAYRWRGPKRYVMDVYVDRGRRVWIVDFGEWGTTDALLFQWAELEDAQWPGAQFRCAVGGVRPSDRVFHGLPIELRNPAAMQNLVEAARRLTVEENQRTDSDSASESGENAESELS